MNLIKIFGEPKKTELGGFRKLKLRPLNEILAAKESVSQNPLLLLFVIISLFNIANKKIQIVYIVYFNEHAY